MYRNVIVFLFYASQDSVVWRKRSVRVTDDICSTQLRSYSRLQLDGDYILCVSQKRRRCQRARHCTSVRRICFRSVYLLTIRAMLRDRACTVVGTTTKLPFVNIGTLPLRSKHTISNQQETSHKLLIGRIPPGQMYQRSVNVVCQLTLIRYSADNLQKAVRSFSRSKR